jgi:DNA-directed RNA polymerase sigma subunit (sigma70/sigma32)
VRICRGIAHAIEIIVVSQAEELNEALGRHASFIGAAVVATQAPLSLGRAVGEDGEEQLVDFLPDESAVTPEEGAMRRVSAAETRRVMVVS